MLLFGAMNGELEVRAASDGAARLAGRFPYRQRTALSDRREEEFESRAFAPRVDDPQADILLLVGHDFEKPLASRKAGSLTIRDSEDALTFEARIEPEVAQTTHARDALALLSAKLASGLSPGFMVAKDGERVTQNGAGLLRTVMRAALFELSLVTRPAYSTAQIEARNWAPEAPRAPQLANALKQWRL